MKRPRVNYLKKLCVLILLLLLCPYPFLFAGENGLDMPDALVAPIVTGIIDGETYITPVTPSWEDTPGTTSEAMLSKDGAEGLPFKSGTEIAENGSYELTVTAINLESGLKTANIISFNISVGTPLEGKKLQAEEKEDEKTANALEPPVIRGVKDKEIYKGTVRPEWEELEGLSYEVVLVKDGNQVKGYGNKEVIWEGGFYMLSVTVRSPDSQASTIVNFSIEKSPYNTPNPGAKIIKDTLKSLTPSKSKIGLTLLKLIDKNMLFEGESASDIKNNLKVQKKLLSGGMTLKGGIPGTDRVYVYIYLDKNTPVSAVKPYINEEINSDEENHLLTAWVEIDKLEMLAVLKGVKKIRLVDEPVVRTVISEGDAIHRADQARTNYNQQGQGVKIGVISDSVDSLDVAQSRGELPADVTVLSNSFFYTHTDEGIPILEIVHDLAPQASLYFHDCGRDIIAFNNAVTQLRLAGCDIIIDDIGWKYEQFFEDGIVAKHVQKEIEEHGIIYVSSAGNSANRHYQGSFHSYVLQDDRVFHDFSQGSSADDKSLLVRMPPGSVIEIILQWDDLFGESANDYDIWAYDLTHDRYIDINYYNMHEYGQTYGVAIQDGDDDPLENLLWQNETEITIDLAINVEHCTGRNDAVLEMFLYTYYGSQLINQYLTAADSIFGHPAVPGAIAVGAIAASDPGNDDIRYYSSQGPVSIIDELQRLKPDLCGIDGVTVTWGSPDDTVNFPGTSAAAPHIAAIAGLLKAEYPELTYLQVKNILSSTAVDLGEVNFDPVFGHGRADALNAIMACDIIPPQVTADTQSATNDAGESVSVASSEPWGKVYIIKDGVLQATLDDFNSAIGVHQGSAAVVTASQVPMAVSTEGLEGGIYYAYAVDGVGNISPRGDNEITVTDVVPPVVLAEAQTATNDAGQSVNVASSEATGNVYIIKDGVLQESVDDFNAAIAAHQGSSGTVIAAGEDVAILTTGMETGLYYAYAVDDAGNISIRGDNKITIIDADMIPPEVTAPVQIATCAPDQSVNVASSEAEGNVYIIKEGVQQETVDDFNTAIAACQGAAGVVVSAETNVEVSTTGLVPGTYYAYAVDQAGNISVKGNNAIVVENGGTYSTVNSTVEVDRMIAAADENSPVVFTIYAKDENFELVDYCWVYIKSERGAVDTFSSVEGFHSALVTEGDYTLLMAGENGRVVFSVTSGTPGTTEIGVYNSADDSSNLPVGTADISFYQPPAVVAEVQSVTNASDQVVLVASNVNTGCVYIIKDGEPQATIADFDTAVAVMKGSCGAVIAAEQEVELSTAGLFPGVYYPYAVDGDGHISPRGENSITITDGIPPVVTAAEQNATDEPGQLVYARSNEDTGSVYIIMEGVAQATLADFTAAVEAKKGASANVSAADQDAELSTTGLKAGTYYPYAVDEAGNISTRGENPINITDATPPTATLFPANGAKGVGVGSNLTISFSEPVRMLDDSELTNDNAGSLITLNKSAAAGEDVSFSVAVNAEKTYIIVDPAQNLGNGQTYYFALTSLEDYAGNASLPVSSVFTTFIDSGGSDDSGGGGGGFAPPPLPQPSPIVPPPILRNLATEDDKALEKSLQDTGVARIELSDDNDAAAVLSPSVITQLSAINKPLIIENKGVSIQFYPNSLITPEIKKSLGVQGALINIGVISLSEEEKIKVIANTPQGENTGLFYIGSDVYELKIEVSSGGSNGKPEITRVEKFITPVLINIKLSSLKLTPEEAQQLSGLRLLTDPQNNIIPVPLGGAYNSKNSTFSFHTDRFSYYTVMHSKYRTVLNLIIGNTTSYVNGSIKLLDVPPCIINNRTMVPLRFIGEALGAVFNWDEGTQTVTFKAGLKQVSLVIGKTAPGLDSPPIIIEGRTLVPVRYISEAFGAKVNWYPSSSLVAVLKP